MLDAYIGQILLFAGTFAPAGWALCNGQRLTIQANQALYAVIGMRFGGDGVSYFNLPDLRSRVPVHFGQGTGLSPYNVGETGGAEQITLSVNNMPAHTHTFTATGATVSLQAGDGIGNVAAPGGNYICNGGDPLSPGAVVANNFAAAGSTGNLSPLAGGTVNFGASAIGSAGGSAALPALPPFLALNFIIALTGIFPTQE